MTIRFEPIKEAPSCPSIKPPTSDAAGAEAPDSTSPSPETTSISNASSATPSSSAPARTKVRDYGGRPLKGREKETLAKQKPWKKAKLSRSTWFRRRKDGTLD